MAIKPYDELTIQDKFLFQKIMRNKRICKLTLERLLDIDIKDISYPEEEKKRPLIFVWIAKVYAWMFMSMMTRELCST